MAALNHLTRSLFAVVKFLYFPDEFIMYSDVLVRSLFTLYYLPIMAVAIALTHSVLQSIVYSTIVPLSWDLEVLANAAAAAGDRGEYGAKWLQVWSELFIKLIPCCGLGGAVIVIGHKATNAVGEAMVDCFSKIDDKDYPLLAARLEFVLQKDSRRKTFALAFVLVFAAFAGAFYSNYLFVWSARDTEVLVAAWAIIFAQAGFVTATALATYDRKVTPRFYKHFVGAWWQGTIHRIRHLSIEMVICLGIYWLLKRGAVDTMALCVEVLLYLNLPHLFGFLVLSFTESSARMLQSIFWLNRHREEVPSIVLLVTPQQTMILFSLWWFKFHPVALCLFTGLTFLLCSRAIQLLRQFDTFGDDGSVLWKERDSGERIPPHIAALLEDAHERRHPVPSMVSLDFSLDLAKMTMKIRNRDDLISIERIPSPNPRGKGLRSYNFFSFAFPRLATMQSAAAYGGARFRNVRVFLRSITITLLLAFVFIVAGVIVQAAFPSLRPLPVKVIEDGQNRLIFDHYIVQLELNRNPNSAALEALSVSDEYPALCNRNTKDTNAWELAVLSMVVYVSTQSDQSKILNFLYDRDSFDWVLATHLEESANRDVFNGFTEFFSPRRNLTVVSVRGTDLTSFADVLQDVNMFFEVSLYHILSSIVPGAGLLPEELVSDFILLSSGAESIGKTYHWSFGRKSRTDSDVLANYYDVVDSHVATLLNSGHKNIIVTGHSLGGAIAQVVGTRLGIEAVGFSSPGLKLSHRKFGVTLSNLQKFTTTVVSSNDIVPLIGGPAGEVHHTECGASRRELCHAMENMVSTLWTSCPSVRRLFPHLTLVRSSSFRHT
ncbi:lipase, putative [Bodo saltans]|uniref:Lipase, putative n=1 Tax=Bodo saltans TaxID=75058 RepID=A0A0S4IW88_BODSA|nr:lipase, putative [Bodo saltans]|eukprot:CUG06112.1 lipase, putative [Bodo saltans]